MKNSCSMHIPFTWKLWVICIAAVSALGCAGPGASVRDEKVGPAQTREPVRVEFQGPKQTAPEVPKSGSRKPDLNWTRRIFTDEELIRQEEADPELSFDTSRQILARLNARAPYHLGDDMRDGRPIKVPNDFPSYKNWTPLPSRIPQVSHLPNFVLVVKEYPFLGWYEKGSLVGDSYACIGVDGQETEAGIYRVLEKDADHISRSYPNSFGRPAWMPWAMRIYEAVWIHAGDVTGPRCSHGCVTLPVKTAEELFRWATPGAVVLVLDRIEDLSRALEAHSRYLAS